MTRGDGTCWTEEEVELQFGRLPSQASALRDAIDDPRARAGMAGEIVPRLAGAR